jgi:UDP:flavonoid glycosyltransferase YjiC (YdhE family)
MPLERCRVLFFAEGATLAHVARPLILARQLDVAAFDVVFARPPGFAWLTTGDSRLLEFDLDCQDSTTFARRLDHGLPLYDFPTLDRYVQADLALIDQVKPDVIVGDFRLSLSVSARLCKVPYATICDAYWSPECRLKPELPVMAFTPYVPLSFASAIFRAVAPLAFRAHAVPMERLRKRYGLPGFRYDLRYCYTDADLRLFANFPELFPEVRRSAKADFIGPIAWSPPDRPDLEFPEGDGPLVYMTMGSSGDPKVLTTLIPVLEAIGTRTMVATAGKPFPARLLSERTRVYDFLPGDQMCRLARLVICNGGSPTTNQALRHGVPVLGIARNLDQFLNMRNIERFGAGCLWRGDDICGKQLISQIQLLLNGDGVYARQAAQLANGDVLKCDFAKLLQSGRVA